MSAALRRRELAAAAASCLLLAASVAYLGAAMNYSAAVRQDALDRERAAAPVLAATPLSVRDECVAALAYPSRSAADKTWLNRCKSALATPIVPPATTAPATTPAPTPTPSVQPTPTVSASSTAGATPTVTPTATTPSAGCPGQANPACTGVPAGWTPVITHTGDLIITQAGSTWADMRVVSGSIFVRAGGVVLTRVEVIGGVIDNENNGTCFNGLQLDHVSVIQGVTYSNLGADGAIGPGGYSARQSKIDRRVEGFRVGGKSDGCGPTSIVDSYAHVTPPQPCGDWHGDGIQVYDGPTLTARNVTLWLDELGGCGGTAPYFQAGAQFNNSPPDIDGMLVRGGGYSFRLLMGGAVRNLRVVEGSWFYGPVDVICSQLTAWSASVVRVDAAWQTTAVVREIPC